MGNTVCCQAKDGNVNEKLPRKKGAVTHNNALIQGQMEDEDD